MTTPPPLSVRTVDNLPLPLHAATVGPRLVAAALDALLVLAAAGLLAGVGGALAWRRGGGTVDPSAMAVTTLAVTLAVWAWPTTFELLDGGRTPGKRVVGLRVTLLDGAPLTASAALTRNLLRAVDALPGFGGLGVLVAWLDPLGRRVGDLVAGTVVVWDDAPEAPARPDAPPEHALPSAWTAPVLRSHLGADGEALVRDTLDRLPHLDEDAAVRLLDAVARSVLRALNHTGPRPVSDRVLLLAVRARLDQKRRAAPPTTRKSQPAG